MDEKWAFFVLILVYFMSSGFKGCVIMKAKIPEIPEILEIKRKLKNKSLKIKSLTLIDIINL